MPIDITARQTNVLFGGGVNISRNKTKVKVSCTYNALRSTNRHWRYGKTELKSQMVCAHGKVRRKFKMSKKVRLAAALRLAAATVQTHSSDATHINAEHATVNVVTATPSVKVSYKKGNNLVELQAEHHRMFGAKIKTTILNQSLSASSGNKHHTDISVRLKTKLKYSINAEFSFTKSIGDKNGVGGSAIFSIPI